MTSIVALPSGSVLTSRFPSSLPSSVESKMTAAFIMGLPLNFFTTVTWTCEVAGGALYLRPRFTGASCACAGAHRTGAKVMPSNKRDQKVRRDDMVTFYDFCEEIAGCCYLRIVRA